MARAVVAAALLAAALGVGGAGAAAAQRGGSVAVSSVSQPACLNPFGPCNFNHPFLGLVLEGAFTVGPDLRYRPNLVSRADIVSRSPFTVVYRIRPEARWSDGVPVTASDFVFTQRTFRDHRLTGAVDVRPQYRKIRSTVAVDTKTVRVVFRERESAWRLLFGTVLPRHALAGEDITAVWRSRIENPKTGRAIGSGPFLVGGWERGRQLTLVRNPRYWRGRTAHLDRVLVRFPRTGTGDVSAADVMRGRHVDVVTQFGMTPDVLASLRRMPGVTVRTGAGIGLEHLLLRLGPGGPAVLRDRRVRQALAYGLDRNALARAAVGDSRMKTDSAVFALSTRFYRPNWSTYRRDPERAQRLLEQAGCRRGADRIYACGGERLRLRFLTTAGDPRRQRTLELAKEQLATIGVDVQPTYAASSTLLMLLRRGEFDLVLVHLTAPDGIFYGPYSCRNIGDLNFSGYCSRQTERDLDQAGLIVDERLWSRVVNAADAKLARDVPVIPLFTLPYTVAHRSPIRNIVPNRSTPYWNAGSWWLAR